jgi:hypothetical protein
MGEALDSAVEIGQDSADRQWAHYLAVGAVTPAQRIQAEPRRDELYAGWAGTVDSQMDALEAMVRADVDPALIYGDGDRLGAMQPAPVNREGAKWLGIAAGLALLFWLFGRREPGVSWIPDDLKIQKQAIAQIDNRTTDCCLRVQGQIQDFDKPFRLTGTPRYADKVEWPPFHWWCRTSIVLYMKEFDLGLTQEMLEEARAERVRRGG